MSSEPTADPKAEAAPEVSAQRTTNPLLVAALASGAAGVVHAAAVGAHGEHQRLAAIFAFLAVAQLGAAVAGLASPGRSTRLGLIAVNLVAALGWVYTRIAGVSFIPGLETRETPRLSDTIAAVLAVVAVVAAVRANHLSAERTATNRRITAIAAIAVAIIMIPGLVAAGNHQHDDASATGESTHAHNHTEAAASDSSTADAGTTATGTEAGHNHEAGHDHGTASSDESATGTADPTASAANQWPRPWDPSQPIDFSGVDGVTAEQQARAEQLVRDSLTELPYFSDVSTVKGFGYFSIGDSSTGYEHYVNASLINDDKFLDPTAPESLVYEVNGDQRKLVSAMFIAPSTTLDDPKLTGYAGPLMQWHVHDNLCWGLGPDGKPGVLAVLDTEGETCPPNTVNPGGGNPMVHVWIAPHACGPFAALEGTGAGQAAVSEDERTDMCSHDHSHTKSSGTSDPASSATDMGTMDMSAAATTGTFDPSLPIDLSGVEGVTPQQQAFAENLVSATLVVLPQWSDLKVVEAAGFKSIGDGITGHEHYIQWDWINDDVVLDPNHPESLVFEPQPDGSKKLVSAMYMLPDGTPLDAVPDWGGALMQWHVHGDLCFTDDPVAPKVAGTKPIGGKCPSPRVDGPLAPMIHVWITPQECGPFAALDGIGGGQVPEGESVSCLSAHKH